MAALAIEVFGELARLRVGARAKETDEVVTSKNFLRQKLLGDNTKLLPLLSQEVAALLVGLFDDTTNLQINRAGSIFGEGLVKLLLCVILVVDVTKLV